MSSTYGLLDFIYQPIHFFSKYFLSVWKAKGRIWKKYSKIANEKQAYFHCQQSEEGYKNTLLQLDIFQEQCGHKGRNAQFCPSGSEKVWPRHGKWILTKWESFVQGDKQECIFSLFGIIVTILQNKLWGHHTYWKFCLSAEDIVFSRSPTLSLHYLPGILHKPETGECLGYRPAFRMREGKGLTHN